jgi:hypothetical protein
VAGIKYEAVTTSDGRSGLRVLLKAARDHRAVHALTIDAATKLLRLPFERLVVLPPYVAVCSYETQTIVALVAGVSLVGIRPLPRPWQPSEGPRTSSFPHDGSSQMVEGPQYGYRLPRTTYDHEPMSLYWYARQARGVPLLEFLAYYQCIEFYFPTYAEAEAQKRVRNPHGRLGGAGHASPVHERARRLRGAIGSRPTSMYSDQNNPCYKQSAANVFQVPQFWHNAISWAAATQCMFTIEDPATALWGLRLRRWSSGRPRHARSWGTGARSGP